MIIKFSKVEFKHRNRNSHPLIISVSNGVEALALKNPRKVRGGVANFFGETLEVPLLGEMLFFFVEEVRPLHENVKILSFCFENTKQKCGETHGSMVN